MDCCTSWVDDTSFMESMDQILSNFASLFKPVVLCGDFNIGILQKQHVVIWIKFVNSSKAFKQVTEKPAVICEARDPCTNHYIL